MLCMVVKCSLFEKEISKSLKILLLLGKYLDLKVPVHNHHTMKMFEGISYSSACSECWHSFPKQNDTPVSDCCRIGTDNKRDC
jgi:hypothetical protein